jgi:hypothetical protein
MALDGMSTTRIGEIGRGCAYIDVVVVVVVVVDAD